MDAYQAEAFLKAHVPPDAEPTFSSEEWIDLLDAARAIDADGIAPDGTGYVDTYTELSIARAILQGAKIKKALAAELHEGDEDEIFQHWKDQVIEWAGTVAQLEAISGTAVSSPGSLSIANTAVW
jgi:hypothetical protein